MSQFINATESLVTEAIDGSLRSAGGRLAVLDGYPHIKVLVRADWDRSRVAVISGGGSGHEPAHAGFIGEGLLTAGVCGEVFASPSVDAVLAGILAVTGEAGCLLVVTNYTGDRLNFGLAAERARALGLSVEMVIVADDVALPDLAQPRGVAGTAFVHKIAGAAAAAGKSLAEVKSAAEAVSAKVATLGISLDTCSVPGSPREDRIAPGHAELGLGIHGEPGVEQVPHTDAASAMALVLDKLRPSLGSGPHAVLLNNLGGCTPLEMGVLAEALATSDMARHFECMVGPAALVTSLDMRGFSVSILPITPAERAALGADTNCPHWPGLALLTAPQRLPLPDGMTPPKPTPSAHDGRRALIQRACDILTAGEAELNALDAKSGDGDTGATLATAARKLQGALDRLPLADTAELHRAIGAELAQAIGGSSGVLLAILFGAAGDAAAGGADDVAALSAGLDRVCEVGGAGPGDRTMIDALAPALAALPGGLAAAAKAARAGADATAKMTKAKAGRAAYVSAAQLEGHRDPGAEAVARLFEGLVEGLAA